MPNVGDTISEFGREYILVQPGAGGPPTWRLSSSDVIAANDQTVFDGVLPIEVLTEFPPGTPTEVTVSMDIKELPTSAQLSNQPQP